MTDYKQQTVSFKNFCDTEISHTKKLCLEKELLEIIINKYYKNNNKKQYENNIYKELLVYALEYIKMNNCSIIL